MIRTVVLNNLY